MNLLAAVRNSMRLRLGVSGKPTFGTGSCCSDLSVTAPLFSYWTLLNDCNACCMDEACFWTWRRCLRGLIRMNRTLSQYVCVFKIRGGL